ncbi:hypothetical protein MTX20_20455 [Bradyrhizobium sp. ISRA435]|nr:hypothetical protein MTX20_20455 [Bradyrhizobium sp. ISRA435]
MARQKPQKPDDPEQSKAFIEKAREIGADEEKSAADELMGRLAKKPPKPHVPAAKRKPD